MKLRRWLSALLILVGLGIATIPLWQQAYGRYSQWQLEREWESAVQQAQSHAQPELTSSKPGSAGSLHEQIAGLFRMRTAQAAPQNPAKAVNRNGRSNRALSKSTTSRKKAVSRSRNTTPLGPVRMEIPKIRLVTYVVDGTTNRQLSRGPGHFRGTARPGQIGNCAIAGHRNMYGSWFKNLNVLRPGDPIILRTPNQTHTYRVTHSKIVDTSNTNVLRPVKGKSTITLVTCMIPYARHRLIVFGEKA